MEKIKFKSIRKSIIRRKSIGGDLVKMYIEYMSSENNKPAILIAKLSLVDHEINIPNFHTTLLKVYKGKYLYVEMISLTVDTFGEISMILLEAMALDTQTT